MKSDSKFSLSTLLKEREYTNKETYNKMLLQHSLNPNKHLATLGSAKVAGLLDAAPKMCSKTEDILVLEFSKVF